MSDGYVAVDAKTLRPPHRWPFVLGAILSGYVALVGLAVPDIIAPIGPSNYYMAIVGSFLVVVAWPACYFARRAANRRWMWVYLAAVALFIAGTYAVPS